MNVLLYSTGGVGDRLQTVLGHMVPECKLEVYDTLEGFSERLRRPMLNAPVGVAVLLAASKHDLLAMFPLASLLYDMRFILVLPDRRGPTVALGHSLRPRFLSYADSDFEEVGAVLRRMIHGASAHGKPKGRPRVESSLSGAVSGPARRV